MNEALARVRHLADRLADAANLAREIAAEMADTERRKGLEPDEIRSQELNMFARVSAEAEQHIQPGSSIRDLRFSRDELKAIVMHSEQDDVKMRARQLIAKCSAELSERAKRRRAAKAGAS